MNQQTLYRLSCRAARDLLDGLERGDFQGIDEKLAELRHYIALAETVPVDALRGDALHHREHMEVLAGITDHLAGALGAIRERIAGELDGLGANKNLLRHLVSHPAPAPRSQAAGCTSPASPIV